MALLTARVVLLVLCSLLDNKQKVVAVVCDGDRPALYTAEYLLSSKDQVIFISSSKNALHALKARWQDAVITVHVEYNDSYSISRTSSLLKEALGDRRLDAAILFSGRPWLQGPVVEIDRNDFIKCFSQSLIIPWQYTKVLFPLLKPNGRIIFSVSELAVSGIAVPFAAPFIMASHATAVLAKGLQQEAGPIGHPCILVSQPALDLRYGRPVNSVWETHPTSPFHIPSNFAQKQFSCYNLQQKYGGSAIPAAVFGRTIYQAVHAMYPRRTYHTVENVFISLCTALPKSIFDFIWSFMLQRELKVLSGEQFRKAQKQFNSAPSSNRQITPFSSPLSSLSLASTSPVIPSLRNNLNHSSSVSTLSSSLSSNLSNAQRPHARLKPDHKTARTFKKQEEFTSPGQHDQFSGTKEIG